MNSFEFNKIAGAILGTLLLVMVLGLITEFIFHRPSLTSSAYNLPSQAENTGSDKAPQAESVALQEPLSDLLAKADPKKGETYAKACQTCHSFEKGAPPKVGPSLWNIVHRPIASAPGFDYSEALKKKGGIWSYEDLFAFIANPKAFIPGTKMAFAGEKDPKRRADIEAYLRSLSDDPVPFPSP